MLKKISVVFLAVIMILCASCGPKKDKNTPVTEPATTVPSTVETEKVNKKKLYMNPLTGVNDLSKKAAKQRPVAVMINNLSTAQTVQTGVGEADVVYETEVEGGITRLLAVYQDISKVDTIGTVRSARYAYIDLAMGHNAVYVHHGADNVYAGPHLSDVDRIEISDGYYGERISNGLSLEHTLYTYGEPLWKGVEEKFDTSSDGEQWQNFASENKKVALTDGTANTVTVPFSNSYVTKFSYDQKSGKYVRKFWDTETTDYKTGKNSKFKNIIVLQTPIDYYPNGKHRLISLESGSGYYATNGKYQKINWSKGSALSPFKFTNEDGTELEMSAGNTWVCIVSNSYSQPSFS